MKFTLLLISALSLWAQSDPSSVLFGKLPAKDRSHARIIQGSVKDEAGNPADRAIVRLKNLKTASTVEFITPPDGGFRFTELSMSIDYEVSAAQNNASSPVKRVSVYDTRRQVVLTLRLEPKPAETGARK